MRMKTRNCASRAMPGTRQRAYACLEHLDEGNREVEVHAVAADERGHRGNPHWHHLSETANISGSNYLPARNPRTCSGAQQDLDGQ